MRDDHHHIIVITVHTAHALQDDVVGIDHRHVKTEKLVHRVVGDGGRRAQAKKGDFLRLREQVNRAIDRRHVERMMDLI